MKEDNLIDLSEIMIAKRNLNEFLRAHPELKSYQNEIDMELNKVGSDYGARLKLLASMMHEKYNELDKQLKLLKELLEVRYAKKDN